MLMTASGSAAAATTTSNPLRRASRAVGLWALTLALPLGRQLLLYSKLPDAAVSSSSSSSSSSEVWRFFDTPLVSSLLIPKHGSPAAGPLTVGVAVTITGCAADFPVDGAAVLRYSLLRHASNRYQYRFYAIYHPLARNCVEPLSDVGYVLLERDTPVNVSAIEGDYLRRRMPKSGCCGEKELIKFEAFRLTQHPAVILMDMDMLVLKNLDDLIDMVVYNNPNPANASRHLMPSSSKGGSRGEPATASSGGGDVWLLYVSDYHMAKPYAKIKPSQGGFAVLKPNLTIYRDIQRIVLKGDFDKWNGWKDASTGASTGFFWGATTFQGLLPFYFQILNSNRFSLELDWCLHNNMNSPRGERLQTRNGTIDYCHAPTCQDCRDYSIGDVYSVHFTNCMKPWTCQRHLGYNIKQSLCREMHHAWFEHRSALEVSWGRSGRGNHSYNLTDPSLRGYCSAYGKSGYEPIRQPYGADSAVMTVG